MGSGNHILELHASGISIAHVTKGRRRVLAHRSISPDTWLGAWDDDLASLDEALAELTDASGVKPGSAELFYRSPGSVADILSLPASGKAAIEAATMAIAEASNTDAAEVTSAASIVGKTRSGAAREYALAVADRTDAIDALLHWAQRGGWTIARIVPAQAVGLRLLIDALDRSQSNNPQLFALMDDQATTIGARVDGQLAFTRVIDIGLWTLAEPLESLAAGLARSSSDESSAAEQARDLLKLHGFPSRSQTLDEESGLSSSDYLLAIQPVFQRLIVEIKQSIRFNISRDQLPQLTLELLGWAASLPKFDVALSRQLDEAEVHTPSDPNGHGAASWPSLHGLDLRSPVRVAMRSMHNLRKGLVAGGVLAGVILAGDASMQWNQLSQARASLSINAPLLEDAARMTGDQHDLAQRVHALEELATSVWTEIGTRPLWGHALLEIAGATPKGLILTRIEGQRLDDGGRIEITGMVRSDADDQGSAEIRAFAASLSESALFSRVNLGATQQRTGIDHTVLEFKLEAMLVGVPPRFVAEGTRP